MISDATQIAALQTAIDVAAGSDWHHDSRQYRAPIRRAQGVQRVGKEGGGMNRPLCLDLFCGAGGASMGLHQAGFDVIGLDLSRQPHYPFPFVQADALRPPFDLSRFDLIWASAPCQAHTAMKAMHNAKPHEDLIPATRALLRAAGVMYVIENVVGAPLEDPVMLCGTMFGLGCVGAELRRHRLFETNFPLQKLACAHGAESSTIGVYGGHVRNRRRRDGSHARGVADFTIDQGKEAMGIDWMTLVEMSEAIPPAFAEYIGLAARQALMWRRAA